MSNSLTKKEEYYIILYRIGLVTLKRYYRLQIVIDMSIVVLGLFLLFFPEVTKQGANVVLFILMAIYAGLELLEYLIGGHIEESFYLFVSSAVCAFSGFFLRNYNSSRVISASLLIWAIMIVIIKIINFKKIYTKKNLFTIKLAFLSTFTMMSLLVTTNVYFKISEINCMFATIILSYGFTEIASDMLEYLSDDIKFLKE